jgi:cell division protein FtsW
MTEILNIQNQFKNIGQKTKGDKVIWGLVVLLVLFSLLAVYSATGSLAYQKYRGNTEIYLFKQIGFIVFGMIVIYFAHLVNYTFYSKFAQILFLLCIPLLIYTLFFGVRMNEGSRWIRLPIIGMNMQSSELAKLALFMYLARLLSKKQHVIKDFKTGFIPVITPVLIMCALIAPANLSTALLLGASCLLLMFIGRANTKHILLTIAIAMIPVLMLIGAAMIKHNNNSDKGVVAVTSSSGLLSRVNVIDEDAYQVTQAKIAIAQGGTFGAGPGNSTQRNFLPQAYNDFIFPIIIEEYGLMGGMFILFIYIVFLYRCIRIFKKCPYAFGAFLALGLSFTLVIQAMINMAVSVGLFPVTGVTLPLISMGGTSFLFTCLSIGIILSVARNAEVVEGKKLADNS